VACGVTYWKWFLQPRSEYRDAVACVWEFNGLDVGDRSEGINGVREVLFCPDNFCPRVNDTNMAAIGECLKKLPNLRRLEFQGMAIKGPGLVHIRELKQLRRLSIYFTPLSDSGLKYIGELHQLEKLDLSCTRVGDAGLAHLSRLTKLRELDLSATRITDCGLQHLEGLHQLEFLELWNTDVTKDGIKKFQEALPDCEIRWSGQKGGQAPRALQEDRES